jgi:hypothetical protein
VAVIESTARRLGQIVRADGAQTIVTEQRPSIGTRPAGAHQLPGAQESLDLEGGRLGTVLPAGVLLPSCRSVREPRRRLPAVCAEDRTSAIKCIG